MELNPFATEINHRVIPRQRRKRKTEHKRCSQCRKSTNILGNNRINSCKKYDLNTKRFLVLFNIRRCHFGRCLVTYFRSSDRLSLLPSADHHDSPAITQGLKPGWDTSVVQYSRQIPLFREGLITEESLLSRRTWLRYQGHNSS